MFNQCGTNNSFSVKGVCFIFFVVQALSLKEQSSETYYVMEPFDDIGNALYTNLYNDVGFLNITVMNDAESKLFGSGALRVEYEVEQSETWGGFVDFVYIQEERPHNCHGATHMSFWYKIIEPQSFYGSVHLRLVLSDDSDCENNCADPTGIDVEYYYSFHSILDKEDGEWKEIRVKFEGDSDMDSLFVRTGWAGIVGNDVLDLERIRGWRVELSINSHGGLGAMSKGVFLIDQLSCVGGNDLIGAAFFPKAKGDAAENLLEQSIKENLWYYSFYNSEISRSVAKLTLEGDLIVNYTIEKSANWGGFTAYQHSAPGSSYYNLSLSSSISFNYEVLLAAHPAGRSHLRLMLLDNSDCLEYCDFYPGTPLENYYSFHYILDDQNSSGILVLLLQGDTDPSSPFHNPGWAGEMGNNVLDPAYIKGFRYEFSVDSQGEMGSLVNGIISLSNLKTISTDSMTNESEVTNVADQNEMKCIEEPDLYFNVNDNFTSFQRVEFLGGKCCERCKLDQSCLFAVATEWDCYMTSFLHHKSIIFRDTRNIHEAVFWMDDFKKRGEFCSTCKCYEELRTIDCRGMGLTLLPKSFEESWQPEILDLTMNPSLTLLGSYSLESIKSSLKEIRLPLNIKYLSEKQIGDLPNLENIIFEGDETKIANAVTSVSTGKYEDICCSHGQHVATSKPSEGLTFCNLQLFKPGIDSIIFPFVQYVNAERFSTLKPSSSFMFEAAESPEKCAEYCSITDECSYFSYDGRLKEAEHTCFLQTNNGTHQDTVCCNADDYADEDQTIPGWFSGMSPRTRNNIKNAHVLISSKNLYMNSTNGFSASYEISLGSHPLRGAVWVIPSIASVVSFDVSLTPSQVVLYDNTSKPTITLHISDPKMLSKTDTIVIYNDVKSCDTAFTISEISSPSSSATTVFVQVTPNTSLSIFLTAIILPVLIAFLFVSTYLYVSRQRRLADKVWEIQLKDLKFDDPPEVIGRGTFGLVLLAEYRGTQVAVKRVIPPREKKKSSTIIHPSQFTKGTSLINGSGIFPRSRATAARSSFDVPSDVENTIPDKIDTFELPKPIENSDHSDAVLSTSFTKLDRSSTLSTIKATDESQLDVSRQGFSSGFLVEKLKRGRSSRASFTSTERKSKLKKFMPQDSNSYKTSSSLFMVRHIYTSRLLYKKIGGEYQLLKADFIREMRYLSKLRHPCITTVMGAVIDRKEEPMLVMEYMDHGSLYDLLHNKSYKIEGEHILPILRDIAHGMRFLHCATPQVIHGDLKAANILIDGKFRAKVADFGLSQKQQVGATGTAFWMAPELLRGTSTNTSASDVYSFGIILYEVYSRREPYEGEDFTQVIYGIIEGKKRPPTPESCPNEIKGLMSQCLSDDASERPSYENMDKKLRCLEVANVEPKNFRLSLQEKKEKEMTDSLLNEVFPKHIAEALRAGRKVEPETRDIVTIFFSDIVGFTNISSTLPPIKISHMLDRLYGKLDALSRQYDIFKVETIGDAYMAVTNLVKEQFDHTKRIAEFSIAAMKAAHTTLIDEENPEMGCVNIRVGFHSGPVVANVIGSRNPRYCLFGDTVNTASRMESNSEKNRIHCSERAAKLLMTQSPDIRISSRGQIQVKGKGAMFTYWVNEEPEVFKSKKPKQRAASFAIIGKLNLDSICDVETVKVSDKKPNSKLRRKSLNSAIPSSLL